MTVPGAGAVGLHIFGKRLDFRCGKIAEKLAALQHGEQLRLKRAAAAQQLQLGLDHFTIRTHTRPPAASGPISLWLY
jgi:hypothetical protein